MRRLAPVSVAVGVILRQARGRIEVDLYKLVTDVRHNPAQEKLPPLKLAVMGCVVTGPGECEGADVANFAGKGIIYVQGLRHADRESVAGRWHRCDARLMATIQIWVYPAVLQNEFVRLEPLSIEHAGELSRVASPETFRYFQRQPREPSPEGMREFIEFLLGPARTVPFCVVRRDTGRPCGITTYLDIRPEHRGLEIGWTWYAAEVRGTKVNPSCKFLLLEHAFGTLDAIRVCLKTDERNAHSRRAIEKLGARFEGVLRHTMIMPDGHRRNTAYYSILAGEWPGVRAGLQARLGDAGHG